MKFNQKVKKELYVLADKNSYKLEKYKINSGIYLFVIEKEAWDDQGWNFVDGFSFKEKLYLFGGNINNIWVPMPHIVKFYVGLFYKLISPLSFTIAVDNKQIRPFIINNQSLIPIHKFRRINNG